MGKLMNEVLKMVKKCKIYWNKGSQGFDHKNLPGGRNLAIFENLPVGGGGVVTLGIDWYIREAWESPTLN